ncbi:OmpA family protein [Spongiibacter sp. KMU-158]|uniref:OmpA family protein n=1 Tax=Spongiibacter pelagi TaxID=2760804 RepID=A0A927GWT7_9GAMM|nr:OmpA family protein [Spongiibacter pelagi]MBD2859805.1 OmpA family protein [Spongiibacter pelagi]
MENSKKFLLTLTMASLMLVGCASTETEDEAQNGADSSYTYSDTMGGSNAQGGDEMEIDEPTVVLKTVFYFDFDEATLSVQARQDLNAQIQALRNTKGVIRLEGNTDERGTREYNMALGERRAQVVADYMVMNGIPRYRIETVSYGEERRADYGSSESSHAKNRRVELK